MTDWNDGVTNCNDPKCSCNLPKGFWVELDNDGNPIDVCWAYYDGDKPTVGRWIKVREEL